MFERGRKEDPESGRDPVTESRSETRTATTGYSGGSSEMAVIGRSIRINGDLQGEEDLRIEGNVTGTVKLVNNSLTIGKEGQIRADVYAKSITVDGLMDGDLYGSERVAIRKNARVKGNITSPRVSLEDGAHFKGSIEMDAEAVEAALGKLAPPRKAAMAAPAPITGKKEGSAA